jgi:hypothetical protein
MSVLKRASMVLVGLGSLAVLTSPASAGSSEYYVYKKKGTTECEITMRDQAEFKKAKGSSWEYVGESSTRGGAKKIADKADCTKT